MSSDSNRCVCGRLRGPSEPLVGQLPSQRRASLLARLLTLSESKVEAAAQGRVEAVQALAREEKQVRAALDRLRH